MIAQVLNQLERWLNKPKSVALGVMLLILVGISDFLTGYELAFSLFYLIPISLVAWLTNRRLGVTFSVISAVLWSAMDALAGQTYSSPLFFIWNGLLRFAFFMVITFLLVALRRALNQERQLSRTDSLTGAVNPRYFSVLLQTEINRAHRHHRPFTMAYFDLDNFKSINDKFGHTTGNLLIITVANFARANLRKTDTLARLGGDEFALLLPETDQNGAPVILARLKSGLLQAMQEANWPVTFSIGAVTFITPPATPDEAIKIADELMYSVKRGSKNAIAYQMWTTATPDSA